MRMTSRPETRLAAALFACAVPLACGSGGPSTTGGAPVGPSLIGEDGGTASTPDARVVADGGLPPVFHGWRSFPIKTSAGDCVSTTGLGGRGNDFWFSCELVSGASALVHFDGTTFNVVPLTVRGRFDYFTDTGANVFVTGNLGSSFLVYDGHAWTSHPFPFGEASLKGYLAQGASYLWTLGGADLVGFDPATGERKRQWDVTRTSFGRGIAVAGGRFYSFGRSDSDPLVSIAISDLESRPPGAGLDTTWWDAMVANGNVIHEHNALPNFNLRMFGSDIVGFCIDSSFVQCGASSGNVVSRIDGSWKVVASTLLGLAGVVAGRTAKDLYTVARNGTAATVGLYHFDGATWSIVTGAPTPARGSVALAEGGRIYLTESGTTDPNNGAPLSTATVYAYAP